MRRNELVYVEKRSNGHSERYCLMYDGFFVTSYSLDERNRACYAASNLLFAMHRAECNPEDIKVYE